MTRFTDLLCAGPVLEHLLGDCHRPLARPRAGSRIQRVCCGANPQVRQFSDRAMPSLIPNYRALSSKP
eukprot:1889227-Rhodomonas_salina.1